MTMIDLGGDQSISEGTGMNYVLVFRPEVRQELKEAYNWYESKKLGLVDEFI